MATPNIFRIVCMDGGDGRVTAQLLENIHLRLGNDQDRFLNHADVFVGTSAGGINSLLLAAQDNGKRDAFIPSLYNLWGDLLLAMLPLPPSHLPPEVVQRLGPFGPLVYPLQLAQYLVQLGLSLTGFHNLVNNTSLRTQLQAQLGTRTLGELSGKVAVVSLQLDNEALNPVDRRWTSKIFTNVLRPNDSSNVDVRELCIDVALRTSAQPIYFPIFQSISGGGPGFIDGGYVANNPSMVAIAQALSMLSAEPGARAFSNSSTPALAGASAPGEPAAPAKVLMLSLGAGGRNMFPGPSYLGPAQVPFVGGNSYWGYASWLLNPFAPFLLLNVFLQGQGDEASFQALNVLSAANYRRLDPRVQNAHHMSGPQLRSHVSNLVSDQEYDDIVGWLNSSGWLQEQPAN